MDVDRERCAVFFERRLVTLETRRAGDLDGIVEWFHDDGSLAMIQEYCVGRPCGVWLGYDADGELAERCDWSLPHSTCTPPCVGFARRERWRS